MAREQADPALARSLAWALDRMAEAGYSVTTPVTLQVDSTLQFMGYAKHEGGTHVIVVAAWALDSEMLGGLLLHELAHIYHMERRTPSHQTELIHEILGAVVTREGLTPTETQYLMDAFNHLQNILADDIVFTILRSEREAKLVQRFFTGWVSDHPLGNAAADAALLARNAFAIASLKRRGLYHPVAAEMSGKNQQFLTLYGGEAEKSFGALETFLEEARTDWDAAEFRRALASYLEQMAALMRRDKKAWADLR